ncbi:transcriptional repressor LexA [Proteiniclasticum sp. BAD-10]|uniref:Transcriptional repressor LexA n=1 Tax=Proteiniclasticum sediminis TaxID=2804028 RepID=A0A941CPJ7_9CLOT|nr:transcriptional repressor LexA [Proteiniclasticum sediminis]MBR0575724.1 transcriptional repressor LexA [Proteiniclasticum sediminis]
MNLGERIKERREMKGLTLEEVGQYVGVTKSTVRKWETGDIENMKRDKIAKLAEVLSVSPLFIMGMIDTYQRRETSGISIPLLGTIAAGLPILAEQNIEEYFNLDKKIKADFCLRIQGDSMVNVNILDGDIVFIKQREDLENGEIGAILIGSTATLKRFYRTNGQVILQAENPAYQPIVLDHGDVRILGKAVANLRQFK